MYEYRQINHLLILTHSVLVGLTPLIPIPFLDDWVKGIFSRRMIRQLGLARGVVLAHEEIETLTQEDFWDNCVEGCLMLGFRLLRKLFRKVFFWIEWRNALNLVSVTYYSGFLLDAALMDGYLHQGPPLQVRQAVVLREAIRNTRSGANLQLIQRLIRPRAFLKAAFGIIGQALRSLPRMIIALPGSLWRGIRTVPGAAVRGVTSFPRRARESFYLRIQVLLGRERAPEIIAVERLAQSMLDALLKIEPGHFNNLRDRLHSEITRLETAWSQQPPPATQANDEQPNG
jgi:hypothetical protein